MNLLHVMQLNLMFTTNSFNITNYFKTLRRFSTISRISNSFWFDAFFSILYICSATFSHGDSDKVGVVSTALYTIGAYTKI